MKKLLTITSILAALFMLFGCSSTKVETSPKKLVSPEEEQKNNSDYVFQVFNNSGVELEVWPETTTVPGVLLTYERITLKPNELTTFYLNSKQLEKDLDAYQKSNSTNFNKESEVWVICGYKQTGYQDEKWTGGIVFNSIKGKYVYARIDQDLSNQTFRYELMKDSKTSSNFVYKICNNADEPVYVGTFINSNNNIAAVSENKLIQPKQSYDYYFDINTLKEKYPNGQLIVQYEDKNKHFIDSGWGCPLDYLQNSMIFTINSLTDYRYNHNHITSIEMNKYRVENGADFEMEIRNNTGKQIVITDYIYDTKIKYFYSAKMSQDKGVAVKNGETLTLKYSVDKLLKDYNDTYRIGYDCITEDSKQGSWWTYHIMDKMKGQKYVAILTTNPENGYVIQTHNYFDLNFVSKKQFTVIEVKQQNGKGYCYFVTDTPEDRIDCFRATVSHAVKDDPDSIFFEKPCKDEIESKLNSGAFTKKIDYDSVHLILTE